MSLPYTEVAGRRKHPAVSVFSLTGCETCRTARKFLEENGFAYRWLEVNTLPREDILQLKKFINPQGEKSILYPVLGIDDRIFIHGYDPDIWRRNLDKEADGEEEA